MQISHALDFRLGWHTTQVVPYLKPSMGDSVLHSSSVVVVISKRQGENHFSLNQKPTVHGAKIGGLGRKAASDEYPPSPMVDND